jgi:hypothetical protein
MCATWCNCFVACDADLQQQVLLDCLVAAQIVNSVCRCFGLWPAFEHIQQSLI